MSQIPNLSCFGLGTSAHSIKEVEPLLFRLNGEFRTFLIPEGMFLEFYPNGTEVHKSQVFHGPFDAGEYFLIHKEFRTPPLGAITYRVRIDGTLQFLDENIH